MKKNVIFFFILLLTETTSPAQYVITKLWDKTLGGNRGEGGDYPSSVAQMDGYSIGKIIIKSLPNGNILIGGCSVSGISGDKTQSNWDYSDSWLVTIDSTNGQKIADYHFGGIGGERLADFAVLSSGHYFITVSSQTQSATGNYSVAVTSPIGISDHSRYLLLDNAFNKIWDRIIQGGQQEPTRAIWYNNQYYMLFYGNYLNSTELTDTLCDGENSNSPSQIALAIYDSSGTIAWDHLYSGGALSGYNRAYDILPIDNNQFLLSGFSTDSTNGCELTDTSAGLTDVSLFKIDSVGNLLWHRCYGGIGAEEGKGTIVPTTDGNYLFSAVSNSPQGGELSQPNPAQPIAGADSLSLWIVKIDAAGNIIWDKRYGGCHSITKYCKTINTQDGGFLIGTSVGSTKFNTAQDSLAGCDVSENGRGLADYWLLKLDSAGNKQWDKRWGGSERDGLYDLIQLSDGTYVVAGFSFSSIGGDKTEDNRDTSHTLLSGVRTPSSTDFWIVRFRADQIVGTEELSAISNWQMAITPNPAKDICTITSTLHQPCTLTLYDITGRALLQQPFVSAQQLSISTLAKGIYIVEVKDKEGRSVKGKLVKE